MKILTILIQSYLTTAIGLIISIISARALSVSDRGDLAVLLLFAQASSRLVIFGFEQIIYNEGLSKEIYRQMVHFITRALFFAPLIIFLVSPLINSTILDNILIFLSIFAVSILRLNIAGSIYGGQIKELLFINISQVVINVILYAILYLLNITSKDAFFGAWVLTVFIFAFLSHVTVRKVDSEAGTSVNLNSGLLFKKGLSYAHIVIPELMISFCIEIVSIRIVLGSFIAGLYTVSNTLGGLYFQIFSTVYAVVAKSKRINQKLALYSLMILIGILIIFVGPTIITLVFGDKYSGAASILPWIILSAGTLGLSRLDQVDSKKIQNMRNLFLPILLLIFILTSPLIFQNESIIPYISTVYVIYALSTIIISRVVL